MKRNAVIVGALVLFAVVVGLVVQFTGKDEKAPPSTRPQLTPVQKSVTVAPTPAVGPKQGGKLTISPEKRARADKIRADYEEMRAKQSAERSADLSAGSLNAYLQRLALLEREKHRDLAAVLSEDELADYEVSDTSTGQTIHKLLDGTPADDDMRRAAFKLQRQFDLDYGYTFDLAPASLLQREQARQHTVEAIRAVLGDQIFSIWLQRDDAAYQRFAALAEQQQQKGIELELWRAKNDFTLQILTLRTQNLPADQFKASVNNLRTQSESRVTAIIGPVGVQRGGKAVFDWILSAAPK